MLIRIPLAEDLVARTAAEALRGDDPARTTVVFPGRRFLVFLRRELARQRPPPFFPPRLVTLEALTFECHRLRHPGFVQIDEWNQSFRLWQCLQEERFAGLGYGDGGGDRGFVGWFSHGQQLLRAVEEVLAEVPDLEAIPEEAFRRLAELGDSHREYRSFIGALPRLALAYCDRLTAAGEVTRGTAARSILDLARRRELPLPEADRWLLVGFSALSPVEEALLQAIVRSAPADLLLQGDPAAGDDPRSPFAVQRETCRTLGFSTPPPGGTPDSSPFWRDLAARVVVHPCPSTEAEMVGAAEVVARAAGPGGGTDGGLSVGVVLPDPGSLVPFVQNVAARLGAGEPPVSCNITLGYPFARTPLCQLLLAVLDLAAAAEGGPLTAAPYLAVLRHPFVKGNGEAGGGYFSVCHLLEETIADLGLLAFSPVELEEALGETLKAREKEGFLIPEVRETLRAAAADFHRRFVWSGGEALALLPFLAEVMERIAAITAPASFLLLAPMIETAGEILSALREFAESHRREFGPVRLTEVVAWLRAALTTQQIGFEGTPLRGIQVMGMLEFRGLSFHEVVVLDTLEGVLPGIRPPDPLLPREIRLALGMRTHDDTVALYAAHFFALLGRCRKVHLFTPQQPGGGGAGEPSRFITRLKVEAGWAGAEVEVEHRLFPVNVNTRPRRGVEKTETILARLDEQKWSVSAIGTYVTCPLRFYYGSVLGLAERQAVAEPDSRFWGNLVHDVLLESYRPLLGQTLDPPALDAVRARMPVVLDECFRAAHLPLTRGAVRIRRWVTEHRLTSFLAADRERIGKSPAEVSLQSLEWSVARWVTWDPARPPIHCQGRIDRLEQCGDRLTVIDYKTGARRTTAARPGTANMTGLARLDEAAYRQAMRAFARRFPGIQIMSYLWLLEKDAGPDPQGLFAYVGERQRPFHSIWPGKSDGEERAALAGEFVTALRELAADLFLRPVFLPIPGRACDTCPFTLSCGDG